MFFIIIIFTLNEYTRKVNSLGFPNTCLQNTRGFLVLDERVYRDNHVCIPVYNDSIHGGYNNFIFERFLSGLSCL